jgi:hypothetical protein
VAGLHFSPSWGGLNVSFNRIWTVRIAIFGMWALTGVIAAVKAFVSWFWYDELADAVADWIKDHFGEGIDEANDIFMNHPQQCLRLSIQWFPWLAIRWSSYKVPKSWCNAKGSITS